jgi:hypothetical protein
MSAMMTIHGRQTVQDAPAHGGVILFSTLTGAGIISIPTFFLLAVALYEKLQSTSSV